MKKTKKRRSAFVPRLLLPAALVTAVPACVLAACGGDVVVQGSTGTGGNATTTSTGFVVAAVAYPAYEAGSPTTSGSSSSSTGFTVAAVAYPAYEAGAG